MKPRRKEETKGETGKRWFLCYCLRSTSCQDSDWTIFHAMLMKLHYCLISDWVNPRSLLLSGQQRVLWLLSQWVFHITVLHAGSRPAPRQATFLRQPAAPPAVMASGWEVTNTWRWSHCKTNVLTLRSPSPDWHHASWSWMVSGNKTTCEMIFTAISRNLSFAKKRIFVFFGIWLLFGLFYVVPPCSLSMWHFSSHSRVLVPSSGQVL